MYRVIANKSAPLYSEDSKELADLVFEHAVNRGCYAIVQLIKNDTCEWIIDNEWISDYYKTSIFYERH